MRSVGIDLKKHLEVRPAPVRGRATEPVRIRNASGAHEPGYRAVQAGRRSSSIRSPPSADPRPKSMRRWSGLPTSARPRASRRSSPAFPAVDEQMSESERSVSSLMDTWISLRDIEADGERNRILYLLKSRGMSHSNQIREYELSDDGIHLTDALSRSGGRADRRRPDGAGSARARGRARADRTDRATQTPDGAQARCAGASDRRNARGAGGRGGRGFEARRASGRSKRVADVGSGRDGARSAEASR